MDFEFSSDTQMLRDMVRRFVHRCWPWNGVLGRFAGRDARCAQPLSKWGWGLLNGRCGGGGLFKMVVVEMSGTTFVR
jgi:hypothetical protein